jgi:hypothetical protein
MLTKRLTGRVAGAVDSRREMPENIAALKRLIEES